MKSKFESFEMKTVPRSDIHGAPYNPRKIGTMQKKRLRDGIKKHGLVQPIIVNSRTMNIVGGHQRLSQLDKLEGSSDYSLTVAVIDVDESEEAQINIELNNASMQGEWDFSKLAAMPEAFSFDFQEVGFTVPDVNEIFDNLGAEPPKPKEHEFYGDERLRTDKAYNLDIVSMRHTLGKYQFPVLEGVDVKPDELIPFNLCMTSENFDYGVHFCIDDYRFERVWNQPQRYLEMLRKFQCVICPDFSIYLDMPYPMKIWNIYRSRALGNWWQRNGLTVVPNVTWSGLDSFDYSFDGIPRESTIFISTIGVQREQYKNVVLKGMERVKEQIRPNRVLMYGISFGFDFGCEVVQLV